MSGSAAARLPESGFCRQCGSVLTAETRRVLQGVPYCRDCFAKLAGAGPAGRAPAPAAASARPPALDEAPSSLLAFLLGIVPGLGAVYNGQYLKGLVHVLMFGSLLTVVVEGEVEELYGLLVPLMVFLVLYQPFEAMRTARALRHGKQVSEFSGIAALLFGGAPSVAGSVAWIALGVVFLLHALDVWTLADVLPFWPLPAIAFGAWRLFRAVLPKQHTKDGAADRPANALPRGEPVE